MINRLIELSREVSLPPGYYISWSGRWENQERARQRLTLVLPLVLLVIFVLLYFTYHSVREVAHVLLAVPFALTGGVYLLWLLGYRAGAASRCRCAARGGAADGSERDCSGAHARRARATGTCGVYIRRAGSGPAESPRRPADL